MGYDAFDGTTALICREGSYAHKFCLENQISFLFDYQFEAFHGIVPSGFERLSAPFLADEEQPYIFISYSHRDRNMILPIIKKLYESGWRIWYDEGLTIGDKYDETLETHVQNCSAFLLFATGNSLNSQYCRENEIPWAVRYGKPIVKCILEENIDYEIREGAVAATVSQAEIESALENIKGLARGEERVAKGISVVVNPADREESADQENETGYAYCLYAAPNATTAQAIILEAKNSGCVIYDAVENGADSEKLKSSACLIAFLDKAFLSDESLTGILIKAYQDGRDLAVCQLEELEDGHLPEELVSLHKMQWLNFVYGITPDMNTKLARHLQKRGCRDAATLPGLEYSKTEQGIVIKRYTGIDPNPRIENEYGGTPVVEIAQGAFRNCIRVKTVTLARGIRSIGAKAFENCIRLTDVLIPDTVTEIGDNAFNNCQSLKSIGLPNSVTELGKCAFLNCAGLESVSLSGQLTKLRDSAFRNCKALNSVRIPDSATEIGTHAFEGCSGLLSVALPRCLTSIKAHAFQQCSGLISPILPDSVISIESYAFKDCSDMTSINIPGKVTYIGENAFENCVSLNSIDLPDGIAEIESYVFKGCAGLASVTLPDSIESIGREAFLGCSVLSSINLPGKLTVLEISAFEGCSKIVSVALPDHLKYMGNSVFRKCTGLTSINIPDHVSRIEASTFEDCGKLASVTIPGNIKEIGDSAFAGCTELIRVNMNEGITRIGKNAFKNCTGLKTLSIPDSVTEISSYAFFNCTGLTSATLSKNLAGIEDNTFENCSGLISVSIPGNVRKIEYQAFCGCTDLESVHISDGLMEIGRNAFENCTSLISITLPDTVSKIGANAFENCISLSSVTIPHGVKDLQYCLFRGCADLNSVSIPSGVTDIWDESFKDCKNLSSVSIPDGVRSIRTSAFENCTSLISITLPDSVEKIGRSAFNGCPKLKVYCSPDFPAWKDIENVPVEYNAPGKPDHPDLPYEGDKPYVFVSYAFRNEKEVFRIIRDLQDKGLRVWYERQSEGFFENIHEAEYHVEDRIRGCSFAIMFSSPYWLQAERCRREFHYIDRLGKPCLIVLMAYLDHNWDITHRLYQHPIIETENWAEDPELYRKLYEVQEIRELLPSSKRGSKQRHANASSSGKNLFQKIFTSIRGKENRKK